MHLVWQNQTQATEKQIRAEFEQLRQFLQREEEARLAALQQEDEEKRELVRKKSESITRDILTFSHAVIALENEIASDDVLFLQVTGFSKKARPSDLSLTMNVTVCLILSELLQHKEKVHFWCQTGFHLAAFLPLMD